MSGTDTGEVPEKTDMQQHQQRLKEWVDHLAHWLPAQGPIKDFIHHNTLHAYQHLPFERAVRVAARMVGARPYLPLAEYRRMHGDGRISNAALAAVLKERGNSQGIDLEHLMNARGLDDGPAAGIATTGYRVRWRERYRLDMDARVHPILFRLISGYLDQGVAVWRMPHAQDSLYSAVRQMAEESFLPFPPFDHPEARRLLELEPEDAVLDVLDQFFGTTQQGERYLVEISLAHPGWSGMVHTVEASPSQLVLRRRARLMDFIALELILERVISLKEGAPRREVLAGPSEALLEMPVDREPEPSDVEKLQELWHEALERTYSDALLQTLAGHGGFLESISGQPSVQAFFCIDDRECSIRRHLEEVDPLAETYGTAGFFGVDCVFQGVDDAFPLKHCPVPISPKHLIREIPPKDRPRKKAQVAIHLQGGSSNTLVRGWLVSQILGFGAAVRLAWSLLSPKADVATVSALSKVDRDADLAVARSGDELHEAGYFVGYTAEEMADRVQGLLRSTGAAAKPLARLVVLLGHGASSVNNPYFSAYDCGACSGKAGAPNSRAFALMANDPKVREILLARGLQIPEDCWFVGGLHDTTRDEVDFYDLERLPASLQEDWRRFRRNLEQALGRNAQERCRRFALVPLSITETESRQEAFRRSTAIFEPRPELNHATNAAAIVGRRALTRGLFLDRRAFLNSYDPSLDPRGDILVSILSAVVPVCGGINLEYFFSRVDPKVYGAGSKLPHNVSGLIGVTNGTEGDLLTGLPTQMTETHDPVRLSIVVEQQPSIALEAATRNPGVLEWIHNGWVRYFCVVPAEQSVWRYQDGKMVRVEFSGASEPRVVSQSTMAFSGTRENAPVARILSEVRR
jgi:uncharacterized protein YbcC (UPF0753/DUF2309 family)